MPDDDSMSYGATTPSTEQSPADRLKELQAILQRDDEHLGRATKERDLLKADVDALKKTVEEIDKRNAAYAKGLPDLNEKKGESEKYHVQKITMVKAALGPKKDLVLKRIDEVEAVITGKRGEVNKAREDANRKNDAATAAQKDLETRQAKYEEIKNLEKSIGDNLQKLNDFRTKVEKNDDPPRPASMFVFLREMRKVLDVTTVPSEAEFKKVLEKRWRDLDGAKETSRTTKLALDDAKATLAGLEAVLAALEKSRVDDLITATDEFNK